MSRGKWLACVLGLLLLAGITAIAMSGDNRNRSTGEDRDGAHSPLAFVDAESSETITETAVPGETGTIAETARPSDVESRTETAVPGETGTIAETARPEDVESITETAVPEETESAYVILPGIDIIDKTPATIRDRESLIESSFTSRTIEVGDEIYNRIIGKSYVENPHVSLSQLRYLTILYVDFGGCTREGELIVNEKIAWRVMEIFKELYRLRYPIRQMRLIDDFWDTDGNVSDMKSIRADNTSGFNYRVVAGTDILSNHALGMAIDLNPYENPYAKVQPDGSYLMEDLNAYELHYLYNREGQPYAITHEDPAYRLFTAFGFTWGGDWENPVDYQHFEYVE